MCCCFHLPWHRPLQFREGESRLDVCTRADSGAGNIVAYKPVQANDRLPPSTLKEEASMSRVCQLVCEVIVCKTDLREKIEKERVRKGEEVGGAHSFLRASQSFHPCSEGPERTQCTWYHRGISPFSSGDSTAKQKTAGGIFCTAVWRMTPWKAVSITLAHNNGVKLTGHT